MATISKETFFSEMQKQMRTKYKNNYECNVFFNYGRWNFFDIYQCKINHVTYYFGGRAKNASTNVASIKRLCN